MTQPAKHTPGPWKAMKKAIKPKDGLFYCMVHEDKEDQSIAPAKGLGLTKDEAIANAHLIAAAPAMYEALTIALQIMIDKRVPYQHEIDQARAALAQADGKQ